MLQVSSADLYNFADLHHHSHFSVLDSLPNPEGIIDTALSFNRPAVAITDHGSVSGHVLVEKAVEGVRSGAGVIHATFRTGERLDIKPIYGNEMYLVRDVKHNTQKKHHITLLAKNVVGYRNLLQLTTRTYDEGFYYRPTVDPRMLSDHSDGLICLSGCESGVLSQALINGNHAKANAYLDTLRSIFGNDAYVELQHFPHAADLQQRAYGIAVLKDMKHVVTCDVHYLRPEEQPTHQMIMAIRSNCTYHDAFQMHYAHPWSPDQLWQMLYSHMPTIDWAGAFRHVSEVVDKVEQYDLPKAPLVTYQMDGDKIQYVYSRCSSFLIKRGLWTEEYIERLQRELNVIEDKGYVDYFLVVADIIDWSKRNGIFVGPGRGSAAGSVVCWGLGITTVDPLRWGLMFERFVDPTRVDLPDIDVDFEDDRREEVVGYIRERYGEENVAAISTFATFGGKQSLWDTARVFRIPDSAIHTVIRHLPERSSGDQRAELTVQDALDVSEVRQVFERYPALEFASLIQGKIRHLGKHAAGIIVSSEPIRDYTAIYKIASTGESIVSVDWRDAAHLNLMKMDILGLKECTILRMCAEAAGMTINDLYDIPLEDEATIELFNRRDFLGVFQFDGQAVRAVSNQIHFESLEQIAAVNAMARPGPLWAQATAGYIRGRRDGQVYHVISYPPVQAILERTYGQIIYQETVMQILRDIGGMDWQDVCELRSIMGKSKGSEAFHSYFPKWEQGCQERGVPPDQIQDIWINIRRYGRHAFNISHAFVYGLLAYWGGWFKVHHPEAFYWAHLRKAKDVEDTVRYLTEAYKRGIRIEPLSLDTDSTTWQLRDGVLTPGWEIVHSIGPRIAEALAEHAPYEDEKALRKVPGVGPKRIELIMEHIGTPIEHTFDLEFWDRLGKRSLVRDVSQDDHRQWKGWVYGKVININKKSQAEEAASRGKDRVGFPDSPDEYCSITVRDDTGSTVCWVHPDVYAQYYTTIWDSMDQVVKVTGHRSAEIALIVLEGVEIAAQQLRY